MAKSNLTRANLTEANLTKADLNQANFTEANLTRASLLAARAWTTNFDRSTLTGACLENLKINAQTSFIKVICQYIYFENDWQKRLPQDLQKNLSSQEFKTIVQNLLDSVEVIFREDIDWSILLQAVETLKQQYPDHKILLRSVETNSNYRFTVKIKIYPHANREAIVQSLRDRYQLLALAKNKPTPVQNAEPEKKYKEQLSSYEQN